MRTACQCGLIEEGTLVLGCANNEVGIATEYERCDDVLKTYIASNADTDSDSDTDDEAPPNMCEGNKHYVAMIDWTGHMLNERAGTVLPIKVPSHMFSLLSASDPDCSDPDPTDAESDIDSSSLEGDAEGV